MTLVRVVYQPTLASRRRESWARLVTSVDKTKEDGYAFRGRFLYSRQETDLVLGSVLVQKIPIGSARSYDWEWNAGVVTHEGIKWDETRYGKRRFLSFRDRVAEMLGAGALPIC